MANNKSEDSPKQNKGGRKPLWVELDIPSKLESICGWAKHGSTDEEMWTMLGVGRGTFYKWKKEFPEFSEALKRNKNIANGEILNSAFKQSTGYAYKEQIAFKVKVSKDEEKVEVVEVEKYAQPVPATTIFMLKNRLSEDYKDTHKVDLNNKTTHQHNHKIALSSLSDEELNALEPIISRLTSANGDTSGESETPSS